MTIPDITILECPACGHVWSETVFLPMIAEAFIARAKAWCVCPHCGNAAKRGKDSVKMLLGDHYTRALAEFRAQGLVMQEEKEVENA